MNKFIQNIIAFSLRNKFFTFFWVLILVGMSFYSFVKMPIEAFPDITNTQIIIITQWPGRSAQEIERFVTVPIEVAMNSVQKKTNIRSTSMFGLSVVKIIFEDGVEDFFARQQVNNLLANVDFPEGVQPEVEPPYGPTGEVFRYVIRSKDRDSRDLLTYQNWVIERQFKSIPGIADVQAFGGRQKIYEIRVNPVALLQYNLTPLKVFEAVSKTNVNVGGDVIEKNGQAYVVRGVGLLTSIEDINNIIVENVNGLPVLVKNLAQVVESDLPRVGQAGLNNEDDVIEGIVVMRKGENPTEVLARVKEKLEELNDKILPSDITLETFYDRDVLMHYCTETVMHNVLEGIILVTAVVFLFMADIRTTVIVSIIIPLALLFAFFCLRMMGMTANLLSLGAVDFGIIIDGAVVMVEGIFVMLDHLSHKVGMEKFNKLSKLGLIKSAATRTGKAVFFSKLIIITALMPIFSFEKVEGKMFTPLAFTLGFALLGALIFTLTLVPVLSSVLLKKNVKEKKNPFVRGLTHGVDHAFSWAFSHKKITLFAASVVILLIFYSSRFLGTEFLPELNEGALWVEAKMPMSMSLEESVKMVHTLRKKLMSFEEVTGVLSQTGRSNDGTDPSGFYYVQMQVNLKPQKEWKRKISRDQLIDEMDAQLKQFQGINYNYSQPIIDNVAEAVAGMNANNAVKIFGDDLSKLDTIANVVMGSIKDVRGIHDAGIMRNVGQPEIRINLDPNRMAIYGINMDDAQAVIEMAIGGKTANTMYEGEKKFDIRIRLPYDYRKSVEDIRKLLVPNLNGKNIRLNEIADIMLYTGPAFIYRDYGKRFIGVKFTVRDRDLGSTIAEAQKIVNQHLTMPKGYTLEWTGEFTNQVRATKRLSEVVPLSLIAIFILLFISFGNARDAGLVLVNVPFAVIGGILALHFSGINFGISAGVGFIALFGICVQNGVILISDIHDNLKQKLPLIISIRQSVLHRTRPIVMTALMASLGLLPAAISTGIGSESQKPLAVVIIGGLITATILILLVFPIIFYWVYRHNTKVVFAISSDVEPEPHQPGENPF